MELEELYQGLERLKKDGEIVNAYGGSEKDIDHEDGMILSDFMEYICINYPTKRPMWMETFFQVFNWQYSAFYEGVNTYYCNFYGDSEPRSIAEVAEYLKHNGYEVIAQKYIFGITDYDQSLPYKKSEIQIQLEEWIDWNTELVWEFYVNILEKHKNEWNK